MKLLFLCTVLFLIYSFAYGNIVYTEDGLAAKVKEVCDCPGDLHFQVNPAGKREAYQAVENMVNEKHLDKVKPGEASADGNDEKEKNMIFRTRRKEDGLSFLWKRINKRGICCDGCVFHSALIIEECIVEGCRNEEITEHC